MKTLLLKLYHAFLVAFPLSMLAMVITPLRSLIETQADFITILTMALFIDLVIGVIKYIKLNKFSFRNLLTGLIVKVSVSYGGLLLFLAFASLESGGIVEWFLLIGKFTILLYPAGSTFANMYVVTGGKFPPIRLMKYLESFDQLSVSVTPTIEESIDKVKKDGINKS